MLSHQDTCICAHAVSPLGVMDGRGCFVWEWGLWGILACRPEAQRRCSIKAERPTKHRPAKTSAREEHARSDINSHGPQWTYNVTTLGVVVAVARRKPKSQRKDADIRVRVTPSEKRAFEAAAARDGRDLSNWLRWVAQREIARTPPK